MVVYYRVDTQPDLIFARIAGQKGQTILALADTGNDRWHEAPSLIAHFVGEADDMATRIDELMAARLAKRFGSSLIPVRRMAHRLAA